MKISLVVLFSIGCLCRHLKDGGMEILWKVIKMDGRNRSSSGFFVYGIKAMQHVCLPVNSRCKYKNIWRNCYGEKRSDCSFS